MSVKANVGKVFNMAGGSSTARPSAVSFSIPTSGWSTGSVTDYPYYYDVVANDVTENDKAEVSIKPASISAAIECGLCPTSSTTAGAIRLRAVSIPTTAISAQYWIEKGS